MQDIKQCEKARSDFELVNAEDFTWLDLKFYNKASNDFKLEGFSLIGDVEFICFNDFLPKCFRRTMCSQDGTIIVEILHEKARGLESLLNPIFGIFPNKRICLTTEFSDGSILYTVTGKSKRPNDFPPKIIKQLVATTTPIRDMIETHQNRVKEYASQNPENNALVIRTFQQWVASLCRVRQLAEQERD